MFLFLFIAVLVVALAIGLTGRKQAAPMISEPPPTRTGLGTLLRVIGWGLVILGGWIFFHGIRQGWAIAARTPDDSMAIGTPVVGAGMWGGMFFIGGLIIFVFARVADRAAR